jgi:molybdopterin converting factor small subunit
MKRIIIRLTGATASLATVKTAELALEDSATYAEVIETLGRTYPGLIGLIIDQDGKTMLSSNMFLVNGQDYVMVGMWNQSPNDGDTLLLVSPLTGG